MDYLYTLDYCYNVVGGQADSPLLSHVKVYIAADFYDIPTLKIIAAAKFEEALVFRLDDPQFPEAVEAIYTEVPSSDRVLRDITVRVLIMVHRNELLDSDCDTANVALRSAMEQIPEFGKDVAMESMSALKKCEVKATALEKKWKGHRKVQC